MELVFNTQGNDKQKEVCRHWLNDEVSHIAYGGSKGSGKSFLGCSLIFGDAFIYPGTHYFIARTTLSDLRKFTIPSVYEVFEKWGIKQSMYKYNGQDNCFVLHNKSVVYLLAAEFMPSDPLYMRFGSMQMTRGWCEESGEFDEDAVNNLGASIGRWKNDVYKLKGKLLQTCNPSKNYLYREYYRKHKDKNLEPWKRFVQALPQDNKCLPDGYLENLMRTLSRNQKERLLFGNWEYDDDPTVLCDYDAICDMFTNEHVKPTGKKYISADLAMQGRDRFIVGVRDGMVVRIPIDQPKSTGKSIVRDLQATMTNEAVPRSQTVADSDGLGNFLGGTDSKGEGSYLTGIKEFHGGASAINKAEYANIKAECAYELASAINERRIKVICTTEQKERIIEEVGVLKAESVDKDETKKRIVKKELMKELLGRSPDYLDMLIMMMYFEIKQEADCTIIRGPQQQRQRFGYNTYLRR